MFAFPGEDIPCEDQVPRLQADTAPRGLIGALGVQHAPESRERQRNAGERVPCGALGQDDA